MKIRGGFVSNSSSTSFMVGCKFPLDEDKLFEELSMGSNHPLTFIIRALSKYIVREAEDYSLEKKQEYLEWETKYRDKTPQDVQDFFDKFPYLYEISASNEDNNPISLMMYEFDDEFEIVTDSLEIRRD